MIGQRQFGCFVGRMRVQQSNPERGVCCWCGGWDLNPRTPTGQGPEPCAFDLSWQPPRERKKERAFDKCLSCLGAVPAREGQSCFRRCQLPNYPLTSCPSGIRSSRRKSFSKKISMLFSTPGGGRFSRAPSFVRGSKKCF